jgi:hypothetical protein
MRDRRRRDKLWKKKKKVSLGRGCNHLSRRRRRRKTGSTWLLSLPIGLIISLSLTFSLLLLLSLFFSLPSLHFFLSLVLSIFSRRFLYLLLFFVFICSKCWE